MRSPLFATLLALALPPAAPAAAQQDLGGWTYDALHASGLSAADLIGRTAVDAAGQETGLVTDVLFSRDGQVLALVIERPAGGPAAVPFPAEGTGWNPGTGYLELPYGSDVIGGLPPFAYGDLRTLWESRDLAPVQGKP